MDYLDQVVRRAAWRIGCEQTLRVFCRTFIGVGSVVCLYLIAGKLFLLGNTATLFAGGIAAAMLAAGILVSARRWPKRPSAALELDERLNLGERVSSALAVKDRQGAMPQAVVADARAYARNAPVAEAFPVRLHREAWGVAALALLALALTAWMPQYDVFHQRERRAKEQKERESVKREGQRLHDKVQKLREEARRLNLPHMDATLDKMEQVVSQMEAGKLKREEAMAKLGDLSEMLREARAAMPKDNASSQALAGRKDLEMTKDVAKALANKDFAAAEKALKSLADAAAKGDMTQEQKAKLEKELQELAKALADPEARSSAAEKDLAEGLKALAQSLSAQDLAELEKNLAQCMAACDNLAEMKAELEMLRACAGACADGQGGLGGELATWDGANPFSPGERDGRYGAGIGGPGFGAGGIAPVQPDDVSFSPTRIKGQIKPGRAVGGFFVNGKELKGEAKAEYLQTVTAAQAEAAQAMEEQKVPRAYETYIRDYFHSMKGQ